jgi:uncharacterized protein (DUF58 family)
VIARIEVLVLAAILVIGAFSTGADFLFFLLYLLVIVIGGAYLLTRLGLADLEAGFALGQLHATVGDHLRVTYTLRNRGRLPKPWLEIDHPSNLPVGLPARALGIRPRGERTWLTRVPLTRRGHYRIAPLEIRTGDPFGLFEAAATIGTPATVVVYPRVETLPFWRLPLSSLEGTHASRERIVQATPLVTSVRPYVSGDAYNRIHWPTTVRQQELYVREFDLEQAADAWIFLDLQQGIHAGVGDDSTLEVGVRIAASIGAKALLEHRAVGLTATSRHPAILTADRGVRQQQKLMQELAAAQATGTEPLVEILSRGLHRLRRGMTAIVVTPSVELTWIRPLAALRSRGVAAAVCLLDVAAFDSLARATRGAEDPRLLEERRRARSRLREEAAEYEIEVHEIVPRVPLVELLVSPGVPLRRAM